LCVEIMLQGVSVSLVAWGGYHSQWGGQMLVLLIIAVAAAEAGIALALIMMLFQNSGTLDVTFWQDLREEGQPPYVDRAVPEQAAAEPHWPSLTPAGIEPELDLEQLLHRRRV
jgi:NADH-quinone oxidoreductase subunit K